MDTIEPDEEEKPAKDDEDDMPVLEEQDEEPVVVNQPEKKENFELVDYLLDGFLNTESENVLDVLAGYFYKIVKKLLDSCKTTFL